MLSTEFKIQFVFRVPHLCRIITAGRREPREFNVEILNLKKKKKNPDTHKKEANALARGISIFTTLFSPHSAPWFPFTDLAGMALEPGIVVIFKTEIQ